MEEIQCIKQKTRTGEEPWKTAFEKMKSSKWARLNYLPHPHEIVTEGLYGAGGKEGGAFDEDDDSVAAYTQTLMWIFTDNEQYAENAVAIVKAWAPVLREHRGLNWYLDPAWVGSVWPQAGELLRASYPKWKPGEIAQFSAMLSRAYLPVLHNRLAYGNRELSVCNALVAIGVFNNDRAAFAEGISHWVHYVPAYFYLTEDGPRPLKTHFWDESPTQDDLAKLDAGLFPDIKASWIYADETAFMEQNGSRDDRTMWTKTQDTDFENEWYRPGVYPNGLSAETCRDLGHSEMGFAAAINVAEIAWHQGIDLYSMQSKRMTVYMEFDAGLRLGEPIPAGLNVGQAQATAIFPTFEIAYDHFHNRMGLDLPKTRELIDKVIRRMGPAYTNAQPPIFANRIWGQAFLHADWETLTHAELSAQLPKP